MKILERGYTPEEQEAFWAKATCWRCETVFACQKKERHGGSYTFSASSLYFRCPLCESEVNIGEEEFSPEEPSGV